MGGKKRGVRPHGIRKKRRTPTQTLAHVAERKEAQETKLRRRIQNAEAVAQRRSSFVNDLHTPISRSAIESGLCEKVPERSDEPDGRVRYDEKRISAYSFLVGGLGTALHDENRSAEASERTQMKRQVGLDSEGYSSMEQAPPRRLPISEISEELRSTELNNFAAALREKAHFECSQPTVAAAEKLSVIGSFPRVGRVSACISADKRESLRNELSAPAKRAPEFTLGLQPSMCAKWRKLKPEGSKSETVSMLGHAFASAMREFHDVFLCRGLSVAEEEEMRRLYVAHCLSHVLRARARTIRNDSAVKKNRELVDGVKDQGFNRARVLILAPMKNVAHDIVEMLMALAVEAESGENDVSHVANSERFKTEFGGAEDFSEGEGAGGATASVGSRKDGRKPRDFQRIFRGNIEDDFKLGISFTKKSMRLYSDFYLSDIIIASPLGLRRAIAEKLGGRSVHSRQEKEDDDGADEWKTGIGAASRKPKDDDSDDGFLSSIEICIIDGAHIFSMQNWDTLRKSVTMMNKMPLSTRDTDFSRVRESCLEGLTRHFRQTIIWSKYRTSELSSLVRELSNHAGKVLISGLPKEIGTMAEVAISVRQSFYRVPGVDRPETAHDRRFEFFFSQIFPMLRALVNSRCLLIVPSYFDYVRVRNRLLKFSEDDASFRFGSMCEYSKGSDVSRARARLFDGSVPFVLMTERFHFFWRHWIRGANTIVWYGLPENGDYYPEMLNMMAEAVESGSAVKAVALYDTYDVFSLESIVGVARCRKMVSKTSRSMYLFL